MRIIIDMQGAQTKSRFRGIGRYTMAFAQAVVRNRGEHEVLLALSGLFPETITPIRAAFEGLLPQENIVVWHAPGPVNEANEANCSLRKAAELIRESFLASLNPDIIHVCSMFEGYVDDAVTSIGLLDRETPVSVTLYDLIPLLNAQDYLAPNPRYSAHYHGKLRSLKRAALYLAISDSSKKEATEHLYVPERDCVNTYLGVDPRFRVMASSEPEGAAVLERMGITEPFVLYTGGSDDRKNLPRLIEAWAQLPPGVRHGHQLLFAGNMPDHHVCRFKQLAREKGLLEDEFLIGGYVSDEELAWLYNLCKLFVFPSWHEGFGLPPLEAMACGAPVLAANTTSLPEVIDLDAALFNPFDAADISNKLRTALIDEEFLSMLRTHGPEQARRFSWDTTATLSIKAWQERLSRHRRPPEKPSWQQARARHDAMLHQQIDKIAQVLANHGAPCRDQRRIADALALNEETTLAHLRSRSLPPKLTWRIEGPFDSSYSLALVNRELARALDKAGHTVVLHSTEGPGDFDADPTFLAANPDLARMHQREQAISQWDADITSRNLYPPRVADMHSRLNLLHAYGWEESGFPLDWADAFNQSLQGMTVMSEHVRKVMVDHGVTVPIAVSSLGIDHWLRVEPDETYRLDAKAFRFLHVSSCFPRKGADTLLRSFGRAFRAKDDVTLVIKTFANPHNQIHQWLAEARNNDTDFPDVQIIEGDYTDEQMKSLYAQCHVLVAPSRAEGFGLPMAEAMLSNLAVITTGWSGQVDFCTEETAWLIDYSFKRAQSHFGLTASVWAEPDEAHLSKLLAQLHGMSAEERQQRTDAGRRLLLDKFLWEHAATRMVDAARSFATRMPIAEPRLGWISTWNTRCGIATYSKHLVEHIPAQVQILAPYANELVEEDSPNVHRCWNNSGEPDPLDNLSQTIENLKVDTLVIQFNYGFFDIELLGSFIEARINRGQLVIAVLHSTSDPTHDPSKRLSHLAPALKKCSRVLVHTPKDMNRLKELGVLDNVTLFPHGILEPSHFSHTCTRSCHEFTVASYGFFLPHKGLMELIEATKILHDEGITIRLDMVNSAHPADESQKLIEQAKSYIAREKLDNIVSLCTEFLTDRDSLTRLAQADLVVFAYQETGESASGAVRYGIASGRPVAVTPLAIFDDVKSAVYSLPGTTAMDIASGIRSIVKSLKENDETTQQKSEQTKKWRNEHRYTRLGVRLHQIIQSININRPLKKS